MSDLVFVHVYPVLGGGYSLRLAHLSEFELCSSGAVTVRSVDHAFAVICDVVADFKVCSLLCSRRLAELLGVDFSSEVEGAGLAPLLAPG